MLLLYSNAILEYPWLKELLEKNEKIYENQLTQIPGDQQQFLINMLPTVIKQATQEWTGKGDMPLRDMGPTPSKWIHCSLCNQRNRYIFYISNKLNHNSLNVGSSCIKSYQINVLKGKSLKELLQLAKETRLKSLLEEKYPGAVNIIENWKLPSSPIIIPQPFVDEFFNLAKHVRLVYNSFLNNPKNYQQDQYIRDLCTLLDNRLPILEKINTYISQNKDNRFAGKIKDLHWLEKFDLHWHKTLNTTGIINLAIACHLTEPSFMQSIIPDLNKIIAPVDIKIKTVGNDQSYIAYIRNEVAVLIPHIDLMLNYGSPIFSEPLDEAVSLEKIISWSKIYDDTSLRHVSNYLKSILLRTAFNIKDVDLSTDELWIHSGQSIEVYSLLSLKQFCNQYLAVALNIIKPDIDHISKFVDLNGRKYTKQQMNERQNLYQVMQRPLEKNTGNSD